MTNFGGGEHTGEKSSVFQLIRAGQSSAGAIKAGG